MWVVAFGNAFDGLSFTGPFPDYEGALYFAENENEGAEWHVIQLEPM